ncbi:hypothetical protein [Mesorhizobium sp. M0040]|uniref:hypothetical protein n=1 Tax=Mesorhizobium sp. M0040 TaxID=2956855 RepID=UPI0033356001
MRDEKAEHALALHGTGALVVPDAREIGGSALMRSFAGLPSSEHGLVLPLMLALECVEMRRMRPGPSESLEPMT